MGQGSNKNVCVIGLGYTGLPTAAILASRGHDVHGVDVSDAAIDAINAGRAHIVEPDLDMLVTAAVGTGKLRAHRTPSAADIYILCVPTPCADGHKPDLQFVEAAARSIIDYLQPGNLIILESTSPPGTTERLADLIHAESAIPRGELYFAHAPERVLPGRVVREVVENDRLIGGIDEVSTRLCADFYATFATGTLHLTDARTAETAKLVENAYRDVNIAFANELSLVCEDLNLDVWELIDLANRHPRVNILNPGPGVGGHCIAVDPWFLVDAAPESTELIRTARTVNDNKPARVVARVLEAANSIEEPVIACLGLAYKADVDDLRESPAIAVTQSLHATGLDVVVVEPYIRGHDEFELVPLANALERANIVVVLVGHREFKSITPATLGDKIVIDTCGALPDRGAAVKA
ncbi:MAG: UDP-N-acetyl-D-mannosamine dehydrogenase [Planctomycetota bacterium]